MKNVKNICQQKIIPDTNKHKNQLCLFHLFMSLTYFILCLLKIKVWVYTIYGLVGIYEIKNGNSKFIKKYASLKNEFILNKVLS